MSLTPRCLCKILIPFPFPIPDFLILRARAQARARANQFFIHQAADGGMEHKIASGLPPELNPNLVPRSYNKLNST